MSPASAAMDSSNPYTTAVPGSSSFPAYGFTTPTSTLPTIGSGGFSTVMQSNAGPSTYGQNNGPLGLSETFGGMQELQKNLDSVYGKGVGNALTQFLASGAGYSPQVLQQLFAQLQPGFEQQQQNLLQEFSAGGGRFSSQAQVGYADLLGQQGLDMGNIASQLYEQAVNNYMNILGQAGTATANKAATSPSTWDVLSGALGLAGAGAGALQGAGVGSGGGILGTVIGALAGL